MYISDVTNADFRGRTEPETEIVQFKYRTRNSLKSSKDFN